MKTKFNFKKGPSIKTNLFKARFSGKGLKSTRQREEILDVFLNSSGHRNLAQIYAQVTKIHPKIGYTTVYRTLKLLTRLGLAAQRKFADGETQYEPTEGKTHHDHLICLECGKIIEFEDDALETLQAGIAQRHRFKVFHHRMELYGRCADCKTKKRTPKKKR
jgi:Fur family ferric uptake transcriptional regulator